MGLGDNGVQCAEMRTSVRSVSVQGAGICAESVRSTESGTENGERYGMGGEVQDGWRALDSTYRLRPHY